MSNQEDDQEPLSDDELRRLRMLLQADDRAVWLWSTIKVWATWIAAVIIGVSMGWDALKKIVQAMR